MWLLSVFFFSLSGCKYNRVKQCYNKVHFVKEAQGTTASNTKWRAKLRRSQDFLLILCQRFLVPQLWDRYPNIIELASWLVHVLFDFMNMKIYLTDDVFTFWVKTLLLSFHYILGVYIFRYTFTKPKLIAFFFLSEFSFTDTDDSQDSRGWKGTIFHSTLPLPPAHDHSDIYLQLCMWDDYYIFNRNTCIYQTATRCDFTTLSNYHLIDSWSEVFFSLLTWWFDTRFLFQPSWYGKPVDSNSPGRSPLYYRGYYEIGWLR